MSYLPPLQSQITWGWIFPPQPLSASATSYKIRLKMVQMTFVVYLLVKRLGFPWILGCPQPPVPIEELWIQIKVELSSKSKSCGTWEGFIWVTLMVTTRVDNTYRVFIPSQILKQHFRLPMMCCAGSCRRTCRWGCSSEWIHPLWLSHMSPYGGLLWPIRFLSIIKWFTSEAALHSPSLCHSEGFSFCKAEFQPAH